MNANSFRHSGLFLLFIWIESKGDRVDTIAQMGWGRPVIKDVTKMGITTATHYLLALHAVAGVSLSG